MTVVYLLAALALILLSAELFTNGIEWFGRRFELGEGAVGSVLAAVGTALPETLIPVIAILFTHTTGSHDIGIGAGFIAYVIIRISQGKAKTVSWMMYAASIGFLIYFMFPFIRQVFNLG